jgi:dTDP-4-dehydrorhamnose reductase
VAPTIVVTGSDGQLGRAVLACCRRREIAAVGHDLDTLDITDAGQVAGTLTELRPSAVVNCAAYTAVDRCEDHEEEATRVNGEAVGHLARACGSVGALLVQVSTDYVFSGDAERPYREDDPPSPISAYGRSKLRGEEAARLAERHLVVRTAWLYGHGGSNFVEAIRRQVAAGTSPLRVVADQTGSPTSCDDLASAILDLAAADARGVVHAANTGATSWHGLAEAVVDILGADVPVVPVSTDEFPRPARRPSFSVLATDRLAALLGRPMPPWRDALERYLCGS